MGDISNTVHSVEEMFAGDVPASDVVTLIDNSSTSRHLEPWPLSGSSLSSLSSANAGGGDARETRLRAHTFDTAVYFTRATNHVQDMNNIQSSGNPSGATTMTPPNVEHRGLLPTSSSSASSTSSASLMPAPTVQLRCPIPASQRVDRDRSFSGPALLFGDDMWKLRSDPFDVDDISDASWVGNSDVGDWWIRSDERNAGMVRDSELTMVRESTVRMNSDMEATGHGAFQAANFAVGRSGGIKHRPNLTVDTSLGIRHQQLSQSESELTIATPPTLTSASYSATSMTPKSSGIERSAFSSPSFASSSFGRTEARIPLPAENYTYSSYTYSSYGRTSGRYPLTQVQSPMPMAVDSSAGRAGSDGRFFQHHHANASFHALPAEHDFVDRRSSQWHQEWEPVTGRPLQYNNMGAPWCVPFSENVSLPHGQYNLPNSQHQLKPPPAQPPAAQTLEDQRHRELAAEVKLSRGLNPPPSGICLNPPHARYFVIKSFTEDDVFKSIKYGIWSSTEIGNRRLNTAFTESARRFGTTQQQALMGPLTQSTNGAIILLFSVNSSGHFCGVARMVSPIDWDTSSTVWSQNIKWKGVFTCKWIYCKDVPNQMFRHLRVPANENKPVTNSRDTQEVPSEVGSQVLRIFSEYRPKTCLVDDWWFYEQKEREEMMSAQGPTVVAAGNV